MIDKNSNNMMDFLYDPTTKPVEERLYLRPGENLKNKFYEDAVEKSKTINRYLKLKKGDKKMEQSVKDFWSKKATQKVIEALKSTKSFLVTPPHVTPERPRSSIQPSGGKIKSVYREFEDIQDEIKSKSVKDRINEILKLLENIKFKKSFLVTPVKDIGERFQRPSLSFGGKIKSVYDLFEDLDPKSKKEIESNPKLKKFFEKLFDSIKKIFKESEDSKNTEGCKESKENIVDTSILSNANEKNISAKSELSDVKKISDFVDESILAENDVKSINDIVFGSTLNETVNFTEDDNKKLDILF